MFNFLFEHALLNDVFLFLINEFGFKHRHIFTDDGLWHAVAHHWVMENVPEIQEILSIGLAHLFEVKILEELLYSRLVYEVRGHYFLLTDFEYDFDHVC